MNPQDGTEHGSRRMERPVDRRGSEPEGPEDKYLISPLFGRGALLALLVWGVVVLGVTIPIANLSPLWPLLPIVGVAAPLVLVFLAVWHEKNQREALPGRETRAALVSDERAEREALGALLQYKGLTVATTAAHTSLSLSRASEVLERLAAKGHLDVSVRGGDLVYALRDGVQHTPNDAGIDASETHDETAPEPTPSSEALEEPLSEREVEVMKLLASGRTNREIASELYVSNGTVKAHTANIYRKLDAHNRAEMMSKANALDLLD